MSTFCYPYKRGTGWRSQAFRASPGGFNPPGGHTGFDQAMPVGTPLYAPGDGIICNSDWVGENYLDNPWWLTRYGGDMIVLDCTDGAGRTDTMPTFILAHLSDSIADVGQRVRKGQLIALSGNSGTATTGPHCHIEALPPGWDWNNGVYGRVNAEKYFTEWPEDINPAGAAAIAPQSDTITPIKEDELSAKEVQEIKEYLHALLIGGYTSAGKEHPGIGMVAEENQRRINALPAKVWAETVTRGGKQISVKQELADSKSLSEKAAATITAQVALAKNDGLTADQVIAAVKAGLSEGVTVDVNVNGGK